MRSNEFQIKDENNFPFKLFQDNSIQFGSLGNLDK